MQCNKYSAIIWNTCVKADQENRELYSKFLFGSNRVDELNQEILGDVYNEGIYYEYYTDGFHDLVNFANMNIYCSDFNMGEDIEDTGGIKVKGV